MRAAGGLAVHAVVGAHDGLHLRLGDELAEGVEIRLVEILRGDLGVELVAQVFRPGVDGEVLGAGGGPEILPVPLQPPDEGAAQPGGEVRVLSPGLVASAPPGIPEDVHVGGPEGEPLVDVPVAHGGLGVVLGASLGADDLRDALHRLFVPHGRKADGLGEHGGRTRPGHAVERLVPPVVFRDPQPRDGARLVAELRGLFLRGHLRDQFLRLSAGLLQIHAERSFPAGLPGLPAASYHPFPTRSSGCGKNSPPLFSFRPFSCKL